MTIVATEDQRNVEWAQNNKGSVLLQKMGWKEGGGIGKRTTNQTTTALRALKRKELLGLGASIPTEGGSSETHGHFAAVLQTLQATHCKTTTTTKKTKKSSKSKRVRKKDQTTKASLTLAQNRCNAGRKKIRESKFAKLSANDMAAIFGNKDFVAAPAAAAAAANEDEDSIREENSRSSIPKTTTTTTTQDKESSKKKKKKSIKNKKSKTS